MLKLLFNWLLSALSLMIVARVIPGFTVTSVKTAFVAALVIGLVNATIGLFLKIVTFPLTLVTLGVFWFVINALMLKFASLLVPGFYVQGFAAAFWGAIILSLLNIAVRQVLR